MTKPYNISNEDVEKTLRYMKLHESKNSTLEDARKKLEDLGSDLHKIALNKPEHLLKLKKKVDKRHKT